MPTAAEQLTVRSSKKQIQEAVSDCISQMTRERPNDSRDQIIAI